MSRLKRLISEIHHSRQVLALYPCFQGRRGSQPFSVCRAQLY